MIDDVSKGYSVTKKKNETNFSQDWNCDQTLGLGAH